MPKRVSRRLLGNQRHAGFIRYPWPQVTAATHCPEGPLSLHDALSDGGSKPAPDYAVLKHAVSGPEASVLRVESRYRLLQLMACRVWCAGRAQRL